MSRILVADDDDDIRGLFDLVLTRAGHDVTAVADGLAAAQAGREHEFDLVVLDFSMPGLTGVEVARALRERGSRAPILMVTASATPDELAEARAAGVTEAMSKPFSPSAISERVAHHLGGSASS